MSFKDDIRQAVAQARIKALEPGNPYLKALADLAEALTTDSVVADVVESPPGAQRRTLRLCARYRPARMNYMMSFSVESDGVTVLTDAHPRFSTRESFEQYLKDFVQNEEFLALLAELERQYVAPVEAYLRVHDPHRVSRDDVLLVVPPDEQRRLAEAGEADDVKLELHVGGVAGAGAYKKDVIYQYLNSAGVVLRTTRTDRTPEGRVQVKGQRITSTGEAGAPYEHMSDDALRDGALKLASGLRGLASIYRRDKRVLDEAPDEETRRKALHYVATVESLQDYIRDQYAMNGVQVRECKREMEKRLHSRRPEEPVVDFFRPNDPATDIDRIANFLETAARILAPPLN